VRSRRLLAALVLAATLLVGCTDDGDGEAAPPADPLPELPAHTTPEADAGDLEPPDVPGTTFAPFPSLGFGIAIPEGWNASRLDADAFERLEDAALAQPFFLEAARNVASTGAVFYAAGIDEQGRVAEIKVDVEEDADTSAETVRSAAEAEVLAAGGTDVNVVAADDGRIRIDFRLEQAAADSGEPIDAYVSRLLVPDDDRLWSIVVTSEDAATQTAVLAVVDAGFVLA
jgi:hypothetical protein